MPKREWKKAQSVGHATTRIIFIPAELVKELVPDANAKTIIGGKWTVGMDSDKKKILALELKRFEKWPPS